MTILELITGLEAARHGIACHQEIDLRLEDAVNHVTGECSYRMDRSGYTCGFRVDERQRALYIYASFYLSVNGQSHSEVVSVSLDSFNNHVGKALEFCVSELRAKIRIAAYDLKELSGALIKGC